MKLTMRTLAAATLLAVAPLAPAATMDTNLDTQSAAVDTAAMNKGQAQAAAKIAAFFTTFAGSSDNATALVTALRNGTAVTLNTTTATGTGTGTGAGTGTGSSTGTTTTTTFTPPTGPMGWGNVKIALALAQASLTQAGITSPTAAQVEAALMGGTITKADGTTVDLKGVLQMRADGMGWGQIAHAGGTNVGPVVSSLKRTQAQLAALPAAGSTSTTASTTSTTSAVKGVTTSTGNASTSTTTRSSPAGITTATSAAASAPGLVTADGTPAGSGAQHGNAFGRGIVSAVGGASSPTSTAGGGKPSSAGIVTGSGSSVAASGVTTAHGNSSGNGQGDVHGKGKGG